MLRLIVESQETAKQYMIGHPQLALAIMQMSFLLGLSAEPALPMSLDDINMAAERIAQLRVSKVAPQKPVLVPHLVNPPMGPIPFIGGAMPPMPPPGMIPPHLMMQGPPPLVPGARATFVGTGAPPPLPVPGQAPPPLKLTEEQKKQLVDQLSQLTPEQVAALPEEIKRQVLDIMTK